MSRTPPKHGRTQAHGCVWLYARESPPGRRAGTTSCVVALPWPADAPSTLVATRHSRCMGATSAPQRRSFSRATPLAMVYMLRKPCTRRSIPVKAPHPTRFPTSAAAPALPTPRVHHMHGRPRLHPRTHQPGYRKHDGRLRRLLHVHHVPDVEQSAGAPTLLIDFRIGNRPRCVQGGQVAVGAGHGCTVR